MYSLLVMFFSELTHRMVCVIINIIGLFLEIKLFMELTINFSLVEQE